MRKLIVIFGLILFCTLIAQSQTRTNDPFTLLEQSYEKNSLELLDNLLLDWHAVSIPLSDEQFSRLSKPAELAYKVFCLFYELPDYHDTITSQSYFIVQGQLVYKVVDTPFTMNRFTPVRDFHQTVYLKDTIFNFSPNIRWKSILFLSEEYKSALDKFFSFYSILQTSEDSLSTLTKLRAYFKKRTFFTSRVKIRESRQRKYYLSNPDVSLIEFNKELTECVVHFSFRNRGGEAQFKLAPSGWILINHRFTYME
jgi:hypothetical protein